MQWWRDAILGMYKGRSATADDGNGGHLASLVRQNPTLRSLVDAAQPHGLMQSIPGQDRQGTGGKFGHGAVRQGPGCGAVWQGYDVKHSVSYLGVFRREYIW